MPRGKTLRAASSDDALKRLERRMKLIRQWLAAEREALKLHDIVGAKTAEERLRARERRLHDAFNTGDQRDTDDLMELLAED